MVNRWEKEETVTDFIFLGSKITADIKLKMLAPWKESYDKPRQCIKNHRHYFATKGLCQFSSVAQLCPTLPDPMNRSTPGFLSITNSRSSLRLTSIESLMPSSHLTLSSPSPPAPNPSQHQTLFQ